MTFNHSNARYCLLVLTAIFAVGCQDHVKAPFHGVGDMVPLENYPRIVTEMSLQEHLRFSPSSFEASTESRPLRVTVPVRSVWDKYALNVQYRFEFYDSNGVLLKPESGWRFVNLPPRVQTQVSANALQTSAVDWRLVVRPAR